VAAAKLELVRGDITRDAVDAVVNAANTRLLPGGGVDGAITRAAGPEALAERQRLIEQRGKEPLPTGTAVATTGGDLPARWIVHTAGPVYHGTEDDPVLLAACHASCLRVAHELGARSIAFPAISTGIYGYPLDEAAPVALRTVRETLPSTSIELVRFVLFDDRALDAFTRASRTEAAGSMRSVAENGGDRGHDHRE
jgi:O-acetyl-ADP-ribose deacetylase (regulator of RNase III)